MRSNDRASHGPRARRLGTSIPSAGCKCQANAAPGRLSPQPAGLKPVDDFCLAVSRRPRPSDCSAGHIVPPGTRCCDVARSGETDAVIAQHSRLQKSSTDLQRPTWYLISASLVRFFIFNSAFCLSFTPPFRRHAHWPRPIGSYTRRAIPSRRRPRR